MMRVIGLLSGTSADGIDAALCEIDGAPPQINARIIHTKGCPYPPELRARTFDCFSTTDSRVDEICRLNVEVGEQFANAALNVIAEAGLRPENIDLIGSHGQTIWHEVLADGSVHSTIQLGEASIIAERTGITTINNFRSRDIAVGGQGAPLTAYADWLLLRHPSHWRAVQNIGGIGNVTMLPPLDDSASLPLAFDTGPGNALIDAAVTELTKGAQTFDQNGEFAKVGKIDEIWLAQMMQHPYFYRKPPKTTGRELFGADAALILVDEGRARGLSTPDIIATITALTAHSIVRAYRDFAPEEVHEVILGGGGVHNATLVAMLSALLPTPVKTHEDVGISSDYKEGLVFALLAYETWHNRPGNHPALTAARSRVVLGQITPGSNYAYLLHNTWMRDDVPRHGN
jgi:anhydro-N-acetylmuramic acid kinase